MEQNKTQFTRFKDAPWFPKEDTIILVGGAGGIGSWTSLLLARAGFKPIVYDFDTLEEHNLGGQLYPKSAIGKTKVEALTDVIKNFADDEITTCEVKIDKDTPTHIYCISAFDNMEARRAMFKNWYIDFGENPDAIFIDSSLTAEQITIYCVVGGNQINIDRYVTEYNSLTDIDIQETICTMKQTSHAAAMIASHIVGFFTNHITNVVEGDDTRTVPFKWEYFIPMDLLEVN